MKRLVAYVVSTLVVGATAGAAVTQVRRHLATPTRTDCPPPWCEQMPTIHTLQAPDDPSTYLGDTISYERPSDWRHFEPMQAEVSELTDGLGTDTDKVTAIADWVKHSKTPAAHAYTTWPPSIIDIWGFPDGQCEEASFLLTAMLRLAGIPAMRFTTWNNEHAAVRAYADARWIVVDATPTTPDNSGPARIYAPDDPSVVPAYQERPLLVINNVALPGTDAHVDNFTLFSQEAIDETAALSRIGLQYGKVAFPVTNEFLYYDAERKLFVSAGQAAQRTVITYHIDALDGSCLNDRRSWYAQPLNSLVPALLFRTVDRTRPPEVGMFYPTGYIETILPTCGAWRIAYSLDNEGLHAPSGDLAYEVFDLFTADDFALVRPELLQPAPGADMYLFRTLVEALEKLPTYEQLGGTAP